MALRLRPLLRLGAAGVSAPLRLDGPLRHPSVALDPAAGSGRTSVVIGGLAGPADSCAPELTAARDGRPGPLPAEVPPAQAAEAGGPAAEPAAVKRVWTTAGARSDGNGWGVALDGKPLRMPSGPALLVPQRGLAEAVAAEWQAAGRRPERWITRTFRSPGWRARRKSASCRTRRPSPQRSRLMARPTCCATAPTPRRSWCGGRTRRGARGSTGRARSWGQR